MLTFSNRPSTGSYQVKEVDSDVSRQKHKKLTQVTSQATQYLTQKRVQEEYGVSGEDVIRPLLPKNHNCLQIMTPQLASPLSAPASSFTQQRG